MLELFNTPLSKVSTIWIDTETTGTRPGSDKAVQIGLVRFENGAPVAQFESLVKPGRRIPPEATEIHGITDEMVESAPEIDVLFSMPAVTTLLKGAQPAAYNAPFDHHFVPPFGDDWTWPWLDALSMVRKVDRYVSGKGRHRLEPTAARYGIELIGAHSACADARAAGLLFYKIVRDVFKTDPMLGAVLHWQRIQEAEEWFRFMEYKAKQPPMEGGAA